MALYVHGEGRWLYRAAQQLQVKPSFTPVTYEEARGPPQRTMFSQWLYINPYFEGRNRWMAHNWASWRHVDCSDIARMDARARQRLRSVAILEQNYVLALEQLRASVPHERALNETIASLHKGEYLIEEGLLPLRLVVREIEYICTLFMGAPLPILNPLKELKEQIMSSTQDLDLEVEALSDVLRVRLQQRLGANTAQHAAIMHRLGMPLEREQNRIHAMRRSMRLSYKHARPDDYITEASAQEEMAVYRLLDSKLSSNINTVKIQVDARKVRALNRDPARWVSTSFAGHVEDVMIRKWTQLRTKAYNTTKLHVVHDMSRSVTIARNWAYIRARVILDKQQFLLPRPYGIKGIVDQDVFTLVRELQWIRDYRIEKFPASVSEEEIDLARKLHTQMRRLEFESLPKSSHRYVQITTDARRERKRLEREREMRGEGETAGEDGVRPIPHRHIAPEIYIAAEKTHRKAPLVVVFRAFRSQQAPAQEPKSNRSHESQDVSALHSRRVLSDSAGDHIRSGSARKLDARSQKATEEAKSKSNTEEHAPSLQTRISSAHTKRLQLVDSIPLSEAATAASHPRNPKKKPNPKKTWKPRTDARSKAPLKAVINAPSTGPTHPSAVRPSPAASSEKNKRKHIQGKGKLSVASSLAGFLRAEPAGAYDAG